MTYRRRSSPLHAARAGVGASWCLALGALAVAYDHPFVLVVLIGAVLVAGRAAQVARPVARAMVWGLPFGAVWALLNPVLSHQGLTVWLRFGTLPVLGDLDEVLEDVAHRWTSERNAQNQRQ